MSTYTTLVSVAQLDELTASGRPLMVFDASFDLMKPEAGHAQYLEAHIPGARFADLDRHLSAKAPGAARASGGRHPLPAREDFAAWLGQIGFSNDMQAVVYDRNGANYCGRLWWMLKWAGHEASAVLDGGLQGWQEAGHAVASGEEAARAPASFTLGEPLARLVTVGVVEAGLGRADQVVLDARAAPRFRGETEPLDRVAGHIPGALNRPFSNNLENGRFKPAAQLRSEFEFLFAGRDPRHVVHQCGSGVSAVPNLLAMEVAGLGRTALFAGSWSEWSSDPARPVAQG